MATADPIDFTDEQFLRWERIGWLKTLVSSYRELREQLDDADLEDEYADPDPTATEEMLHACAALARELEAALPQQPEVVAAGAGGFDRAMLDDNC